MSKLIKNSLGYETNLFIFQDKAMFNYSIDTILLGNFATINSKTQAILEIGTNNGALAIFVAQRYQKIHIDALEIQKEALMIAKKNVSLNNKQSQITLILDDFNNYYQQLSNKNYKYDSIICNPPFYKVAASKQRKGDEKLLIATHEIKLNLEQIIRGSSKIIKQRGYLALVLPVERLVDAIFLMRQFDFEIKKLQFVHARINKKANLVLIEGRYKVGWGTNFLPNIYLHYEDSQNAEYRDEVKKLYKPLLFDQK